MTLLVAALLLGISGCEQEDPVQVPEDLNTYVVRGEIAVMPQGRTEFKVYHEAIPEFVRVDGTRGMNAMMMPFPPAEGLSLDGFAVGDVVELTFVSWWKPTAGMELTAIRKLPADTVLDFGPAATQPAGTQAAESCCPH